MKKNLITLTCLLAFALTSSVAVAGGFSYSQKRELKKSGYSNSDIRKIERGNTRIEPTYKYKSSTGNNYKYDLSNPDDRLDYRLDKDAQMDDKMNPKVKMDRRLKQYGGGIQGY